MRRRGVVVRDASLGLMTTTVDLPMEYGELLEKSLDRARDNTNSSTPEHTADSWSVKRLCGDGDRTHRPACLLDQMIERLGM